MHRVLIRGNKYKALPQLPNRLPIIGWRFGPDPDQVALMDRIEDQKNMTRLIQLMSESSDLVLVANYRNIRSDFKEKLRDFLGHDPALLDAKKKADEQILELQKSIEIKHDSEKRLVQLAESYRKLKAESLETIQSADKKHTELQKKFEDLKKSAAKELSAMKTKHNDDFLKLKAELEEARRINAEFCNAAEPILDNLHSPTVGSNISSFQTVIELLQSAPSKLKSIILESASVACGQALAVIKSLYPKVNLKPITSGYADGTTSEKALELLDEVDDMAKIMANDSLYPEEENNDE
uniref:Uncharacterized protein n=1 Tax=Leersia perrieri TaxID=77586 RepID=A0A0D9WI13_9ORYZ